jgi:hypothetical protein
MPLRLSDSGEFKMDCYGSEVSGEFNMTVKRAAPLLKYTLVPKTQRGWTEGAVNSPQPLTDLDVEAEAEGHFSAACTEEVLRLRDALSLTKESCEKECAKYAAESSSSSNINNPAILLSRFPSNSIVFLGKLVRPYRVTYVYLQ